MSLALWVNHLHIFNTYENMICSRMYIYNIPVTDNTHSQHLLPNPGPAQDVLFQNCIPFRCYIMKVVAKETVGFVFFDSSSLASRNESRICCSYLWRSVHMCVFPLSSSSYTQKQVETTMDLDTYSGTHGLDDDASCAHAEYISEYIVY